MRTGTATPVGVAACIPGRTCNGVNDFALPAEVRTPLPDVAWDGDGGVARCRPSSRDGVAARAARTAVAVVAIVMPGDAAP